MSNDDTIRHFAVVFKDSKTGYVHDYYPEERAGCLKDLGDTIIGDFATEMEAQEVVWKALATLRKKRIAR